MKSSLTTLVIVALICHSSIASLFEAKEKSHFGGLKAIQEIENSKFGRELLDTIALQMKNESPLQDVAQLLADIRADLIAQQKADDELQAQREEDCEVSIADFNFRITEAVDNIAAAVATIAQLRTEITNLKVAIGNYESQESILNERLTVIHADRAADRASFEARTTKSEETVAALQLIVPKLGSLTSHSAAEALVELAKIGKTNPIAAFMEVASTINPELLQGVIDKMTQLEESLQASLVEDAANEKAAESAYTKLVADIETTLAEVQAALATARSNLEQSESKLAAQQTFLAEQQAAEAAARAGLAAKIEECRVWKVNYDSTKASRSAERSVVEQVQSILAERLQSMSQYLKDRVDHDF